MNDCIELTDAELLEGIKSLLTAERAGLARLIWYLAEVEERRLHLTAAYSSMFEFCTKRLGLSEGEAFRRLTAARLARRFPAIVGLVEDGSIHLTALVQLRDHLTDENHAELLREAAGKSKQQLEHLLASRAPQPDAPSKIRKLPAPRKRAAATEALALGPTPPDAPRQPGPATVALSAHRYKVQFTADESLKDKLERAQDLLSHTNPGRDLAVVVARAVDLLLADLEKKKLGLCAQATTSARLAAPFRKARRSSSISSTPAAFASALANFMASRMPRKGRPSVRQDLVHASCSGAA